MKNIIYIIAFLMFTVFLSCNNQNKNNNEKSITTDLVQNPITAEGKYNTGELPVMKFDKKIHDFGIIIQGEKVSYTFKYKNIGGSDLIITSAKGSCGCTVPSYSKKPIAPGETEEIEIVFNSSGRKGQQHKTISLYTNAQPNKYILTITGQIIVPN